MSGRAADAVAKPPFAYRVFISYNHADAAIAAALAANLTRFARPWYRTRAMRVFLDKNSLSPDPSLSGAIERALANSEWLVLIASPNSAVAPWVSHELAWWLANRSIAKLIIARCGGEIVWPVGGTDFDWGVTTALPQVLRGRFAVEPLWADLSAAAATRRKSVSNPVFRDGFLGVAAQIHGVSKDLLWNRERVEQRTRLAFAALALLAGAALFWGLSRRDAVSDDRKENILSLQFATKAYSVMSRDTTLAAQIATAGVAVRPDGLAVAALRDAAARIAGNVPPRFELASPGAADVAFSPRATRLAVLSRDGMVSVLDAMTGRALGMLTPAAPFEARVLAWGAGGGVAAAGPGGAQVWHLGEDEADIAKAAAGVRAIALDAGGAKVTALAFSADGAQLAVGLDDGGVRIVSMATGDLGRRFVANPGAELRALAFSNDGKRLATGAEDGEAVLWQLADSTALLRLRMAAPIASVDFNRRGGSALAEHMLAIADAGGAVRVVDGDAGAAPADARPQLRSVDVPAGGNGGVAARFVEGMCLVRAGVGGPVAGDVTLGFDPLFAFAGGAGGAAPRIAMAVGNVPARAAPPQPGSTLFALLDAAGSLAVYEQPLCRDAEAVCRFAGAWLTEPMGEQARARWLPGGFDPREPVSQLPKPECRALIDRVLPATP